MIIFTDGGCWPNPGPNAVWAFVVREEDGGPITHTESGYIDGIATNNQAEYAALIEALKWFAIYTTANFLTVRSDSELMVGHMTGRTTCKSDKLLPLWAEAMERLQFLLDVGDVVEIEHVKREFNTDADAECDRLIEEKNNREQK